MALSKESIEKLKGVHRDLITVVEKTEMRYPGMFFVMEGLRSAKRQAELKKAGASWTLNGRHITGHAVDLGALVNGKYRQDWPLYFKIAESIREVSIELCIPIRWGGSWSELSTITGRIDGSVLHPTKMDGAHFELPRRKYA